MRTASARRMLPRLASQRLLTVAQRSSTTAVILTLLARLLGPFIAKGAPQSEATTPTTVTTTTTG
jgi:hypothetical protein